MKKYSFLFFFLWLCILCSSAFAQETVWTNNLSDKIQTLSGNAVVDLVDEGAATPWGITVDVVRQKIYWTNLTEGSVRSSDLSGGNVQTVISGLSLPRGLALDAVSNTLYWAEAGHGSQSLKRMNLESEIVTVIVNTDIVSPYHIALDRQNDLLYWVDNALGQKKISRININGSGRATVISTINQVSGITLDTANGFIYWGDFEDDVIYRAETSGTDQAIEEFYDIATESTPWALFYDSQNEKLFWTDYLNSSISRLDTNTKVSEVWVSSITTPSGFVAFAEAGDVVSVEISGAPGWRMMGAPVSGVRISDLASQNLVQGISGLPGSGFDPNLYMWNPESGTEGAYFTPNNGATVLAPGTGFYWYMWGPNSNPNVPASKPFPVTIEVTGLQLTGDVSLGTLPEGWNIIANPFAEPINFDQITGGGTPLNTPGQVWNPNEGQSGSYILTTSVGSDNKLATWQGAFVNIAEATGEVVVPESAKTSNSQFLSEPSRLADYNPNNQTHQTGQIEFVLEGYGNSDEVITRDRAAILYFHEHASSEWDSWDSEKLLPMSHSWATVSLLRPESSQLVPLSHYSLPYDVDVTEPHQIPIDIQVQNISGRFRLSWPVAVNLPANIHVRLLDLHTNTYHNLKRDGFVEFTYEFEGRPVVTNNILQPALHSAAAQGGQQRYIIVLNESDGSDDDSETGYLPIEIALAQNYPNPFNPTTQIQFELPEESAVEMDVYTITGKRVATLVNEVRQAGVHLVSFNGSALSSGVYIYRLRAGNIVLTRKLTLIK